MDATGARQPSSSSAVPAAKLRGDGSRTSRRSRPARRGRYSDLHHRHQTSVTAARREAIGALLFRGFWASSNQPRGIPKAREPLCRRTSGGIQRVPRRNGDGGRRPVGTCAAVSRPIAFVPRKSVSRPSGGRRSEDVWFVSREATEMNEFFAWSHGSVTFTASGSYGKSPRWPMAGSSRSP